MRGGRDRGVEGCELVTCHGENTPWYDIVRLIEFCFGGDCPLGYLFIIYMEERSVQKLMSSCYQMDGKAYLLMSSQTVKQKPVRCTAFLCAYTVSSSWKLAGLLYCSERISVQEAMRFVDRGIRAEKSGSKGWGNTLRNTVCHLQRLRQNLPILREHRL